MHYRLIIIIYEYLFHLSFSSFFYPHSHTIVTDIAQQRGMKKKMNENKKKNDLVRVFSFDPRK